MKTDFAVTNVKKIIKKTTIMDTVKKNTNAVNILILVIIHSVNKYTNI